MGENENFQFRWREPGTDAMNAQGANTGAGAAYEAYNKASENAEIDNEIEEIRRKIAALEIEREQIQSSLGTRDELDRKLAANRARVGDISTSRAHMNDIYTRERMELDDQKNARAKIDEYRGNIDKLNVMLQYGENNRQFAADKASYDRLVGELKARYGVDYDPYNGGTKTPKSEEAKVVLPSGIPYMPETDEDWEIAETIDKRLHGGVLSPEFKQFAIDNRPQNTAAGAAAVSRISKEHDTNDEKTERQKEMTAIEEIMKVRGGRSAGKSFKATNGKTVSIEKLPAGKVRYKCGKSYKDKNNE